MQLKMYIGNMLVESVEVFYEGLTTTMERQRHQERLASELFIKHERLLNRWKVEPTFCIEGAESKMNYIIESIKMEENKAAMVRAKEEKITDVLSSQNPFDCVIETYEDLISIISNLNLIHLKQIHNPVEKAQPISAEKPAAVTEDWKERFVNFLKPEISHVQSDNRIEAIAEGLVKLIQPLQKENAELKEENQSLRFDISQKLNTTPYEAAKRYAYQHLTKEIAELKEQLKAPNKTVVESSPP